MTKEKKKEHICFIVCLIIIELCFLIFIVLPVQFGDMLDIQATHKMGKNEEVKVFTDSQYNNCQISYYIEDKVDYDINNVLYYYQKMQYIYIIDMSNNYYIINLENNRVQFYEEDMEDMAQSHKKIFYELDKFFDMTYLY